MPVLVGYGPVDPAFVAELLPRAVLRRLLIDPQGGLCAVDPTPIGLPELAVRPVPQPPGPTDSYVPTAGQRRVIMARDSCCTFPGCTRAARRCDLDHLMAWSRGGRTTVGNLHPLCRHHHRLKHNGWQVSRHADGTETWTSPRGQTHTNDTDTDTDTDTGPGWTR